MISVSDEQAPEGAAPAIPAPRASERRSGRTEQALAAFACTVTSGADLTDVAAHACRMLVDVPGIEGVRINQLAAHGPVELASAGDVTDWPDTDPRIWRADLTVAGDTVGELVGQVTGAGAITESSAVLQITATLLERAFVDSGSSATPLPPLDQVDPDSAIAQLALDEDGTCVAANPAACALLSALGRPIGRDVSAVFCADAAEQVRAAASAALGGHGTTSPTRHRLADAAGGASAVVHLSAARDQRTAVVTLTGLPSTPVADDAERLFRSLFDASPIGTMLLDADGAVQEANSAITRLLGAPSGALVGMRLIDLLATVPTVDDELWPKVHAADGDVVVEQRLLRADGDVVWARVRATPVPDVSEPVLLVQVEDVTASRASEARLAHLASHDPLTGLANRAKALETVTRLLTPGRRSADHRMMVAALFVDLDGFKQVNDLHGHAVGDAVLVEVAHRLRATSRPSDTVARLGGDEFLLICSGIIERQDAGRIARRVTDAMARPIDVGSIRVQPTASVGVAVAMPGDDPTTLVNRADQAMYVAKGAGKNRVEIALD